MAGNMIRVVGRQSRSISQRALSTTAARSTDVALTPAEKERIYPRIGNRDVVGYGFNGTGSYMDRVEFPCPGIRFGENSSDVMALREKEMGDWKNLSIAEKKTLYRASFCSTYAEMKAPTGEWKSVVAAVIAGLAVTGWLYLWMKIYVYPPLPHTITKEWQEDTVKKMIAQRQGAIEGLSSQFDYEKGDWK
ncbi:cytochrome c oxidase subunit 4 isoform 1, mitochondrial-like [Lineus longissimus]|uniref:cytochrome c oxidase subunit 4 isoform 1, mitochondrial-like n=1 Tax=Lineus longissimus TaxID=88925 RepID=UPI002B4E3B96